MKSSKKEVSIKDTELSPGADLRLWMQSGKHLEIKKEDVLSAEQRSNLERIRQLLDELHFGTSDFAF